MSLSLSVKRANGVVAEYKDAKAVFDPQSDDSFYPNIFITHAHLDHARGFRFPGCEKFSTKETYDLAKVVGVRNVPNWSPVECGHGVEIDDLEVKPHNAGHVLGSVQYEFITPEGNIVYTGDINFTDTLTTRAAEVVPCDVLVMEATFGSPELVFPPEEWVAEEIVHWSKDSIKQGKIPVFQADSIGNAQELILIFNTQTTTPVVTHSKVSRINRVYEKYGYTFDYLDAKCEEAAELISSHECVFIAPKSFRALPDNSDFNVGFVSGWALRFSGKRKPFILSDHADFNRLLQFVRESKPKKVLLCHGGIYNETLGRIIVKKLGIEARPLGFVSTASASKGDSANINFKNSLRA